MRAHLVDADLGEVAGRLDSLGTHLASADPWEPWRPLAGPVLLTGMGSSGFAARTAAGWLRAAGLPVIDESPTADPGWGGDGSLCVLVSASGGSAETRERAGRLGATALRVALVNAEDSPLEGLCGGAVPMLAGPEPGEVACRSYRHTLALLLALALPRARVAEACHEAAALTRALEADTGWLDLLDTALDGGPATFWLAPEARVGSALQAALMVREIPRRLAVGSETGEWSHVDVYLTRTLDYRCVVFTGSSWDEQAADWLRRRGSTVVSVGDPLGIPGETTIPLAGDPIARALAEPLLAERLALRWWGRDPVGA